MNLLQLHKFLTEAKTPQEVFGSDSSSFKSFVKICHPDVNPDNQELADKTYKLLFEWRDRLEGKVEAPIKPVYHSITLSVSGKDYKFLSLLGQGSISNVHRIESENSFLFAKVSNHHHNNDLLEREYQSLSAIWKHFDDDSFTKVQTIYVPKPIASFQVKNLDGALRRVNILSIPLDDDMLTLRELSSKDKFKDGIEGKHLYWMLRRTLLTLQLAHNFGIIHGACNPDHWLIYPKQHGIVLLDWTASCPLGKNNIGYLDPAWKHYYSNYVKGAQSPTLDVRLALLTMLEYVKNLPVPFRDAVKKLLLQDNLTAGKVHFEIGQLIDKYDGPRKFTPLEV